MTIPHIDFWTRWSNLKRLTQVCIDCLVIHVCSVWETSFNSYPMKNHVKQYPPNIKRKLSVVMYSLALIEYVYIPESNFWEKLFIFAYGPVLQLCNEVAAILDIQPPQIDTFGRGPSKEHSRNIYFPIVEWF
jgi:hypothetical protein